MLHSAFACSIALTSPSATSSLATFPLSTQAPDPRLNFDAAAQKPQFGEAAPLAQAAAPGRRDASPVAERARHRRDIEDLASAISARCRASCGAVSGVPYYIMTDFSRKVAAARAATVLALATWAANAKSLDDGVESSWQWLREKWWFQHDSFEPVWATACFAAWLNGFTLVDKFLPSWRAYLMNPEQRKVDFSTGVPYATGAAYLGIILGYDVVYPRRSLPPEGPGSAARIAAGVVAGLVLYDFIFFPIHVAMHRIKALRALHARHHKTKALYSTEVLRHSFVDGSLQVGTNIVVVNVLGMHPLTRLVYNAVITYMLTELHAGFDCPWMLHRVLPAGVLGGPVRHEEHHRTGRRYYQQFFCYLDDYFFPAEDGPTRVLAHATSRPEAKGSDALGAAQRSAPQL